MALINCPECQKEISDRVTACPHCGFPLVEDVNTERIPFAKPVIDKVRLKKLLLIIISILVIVALSVVGYSIHKDNKLEQARSQYNNDTQDVMWEMLDGGSIAEDLLNITYSVWNNSIFEEYDPETDPYTTTSLGYFHDDFNDSLSNLFADPKTKDMISNIEVKTFSIKQTMTKLNNPPDGYDKVYDTTLELYNAYRSLTDFAVSPTGSLNSFGEQKSQRVNKFLELYRRLEALLPSD